MVLSASSPTSISESGKSYKYFAKQAAFAGLGIVAMAMISKIDYRFYKKFYKIGYILSIILLVAVLVAGKTVNGAKRWIGITETLSFRPSELVKFLMIIFYAGILTRDREELKYFVKGWIKHLAWLAPIISYNARAAHECINGYYRNCLCNDGNCRMQNVANDSTWMRGWNTSINCSYYI